MTLPETAFDADTIMQGIVKWAKVESPTHHVEGVNQMMDLAAQDMHELGGDVERLPGIDGFGDVVVARFPSPEKSEQPGILILGHLDTVHEVGTLADKLPIRRDGDKLFGPGVLDMKGGNRLAIEAFGALRNAGLQPHLPVTFMFIPDEEVGSPSSRRRIEAEALKHEYVLVPEPLRPWGDVVTGRHAVQRFWVRAHGQPAHAGLSKAQGRSAIAKMAEIISRIEAMNDYDKQTTYAVGTVHGGVFVNVVTTLCEAQVLCVAPNDELLAEIQSNMAALAGEEDGVRIEVEAGLLRPVAKPHDKTMALYNHARKLAAAMGVELGHCQSGGGSDGNFTGALGIATLDGLGVGGANAHTFNEHLLIPTLVPQCRLIAGLLQTLK
ncbi:M20/M25/M40 family metallo-hydrolase [Anderseniella sp. Alg231-50]|uniref:M20/M25/M40 family metallo-hydrolase n=1 Tax=Anderseniella sp. Alg231-50 TaxID=1922226 RepID=UPI000D562661